LSDTCADSLDIVLKSSRNLISSNYIKFSEESILDIDWKENDLYHRYSLYHGIYLGHAGDNTIRGNTIINASGSGIHTYHNHTTNNLIDSNTIEVCYNNNYKILSPKINEVYADERTIDELRHGIIISYYNNPSTVFGNEIKNNMLISNRSQPTIRTSYKSPETLNDNILVIHQNILNTNSFEHNIHNTSLETCQPNTIEDYEHRYSRRYLSEDVDLVHISQTGELLIVLKTNGTILKVKDNDGFDQNMFKLINTDGIYSSLPGFENLIGSQNFCSKITALAYIEDNDTMYTLIGFEDGRLLKVRETGGTGTNMYAIRESEVGFESLPEYNYYVGSHKFMNGIVNITHINGYTFTSFSDGKILKVSGSGGKGTNVFAVNETIDGFTKAIGYDYYSGHAKFLGEIVEIKNIYDKTFFCFNNGKILKIQGNNGTGGSGSNMFAVNETTDGFSKVHPFNYYVGHAKFTGNVSNICNDGNQTIFSFYNGKNLKIKGFNGTGGSGSNMFAVTETATGFTNIPGYPYFDGQITLNVFVTTSCYNGDSWFFGFNDGRLLKVNGLGIENSVLFWNQIGEAYFLSRITDIKIVNDYLFVSLMDGKIAKLDKSSAGNRMFNLAVTLKNINNISQYTKRIHGYQDLEIKELNCGGGNLKVKGQEKTYSLNNELLDIIIYPNPAQNILFMNINFLVDSYFTIEIFDITGEKISIILDNLYYSKGSYHLSWQMKDFSLSNGIYIIQCRINETVIRRKIIVNN
jgi:hypothetical protein